MDVDDQHKAAPPAPFGKDALERISSLVRPISAAHNSTVDALMAELRAEAARTDKPSSSNSEPLAGTISAERPTRKADVDVLRADLLLFGVEASDDAIFGAWERHSDSHAAGWLGLYGNPDDNVRALLHHLDVAE
jgi:hypothetical protein